MANEHVQRLFQERRKSTHCDKRKVHDSLVPTADLVAAVSAQIATYRSRLMMIELTPHDHGLDGVTERMHQTLTSMEQEVANLFGSVRRLATSATQWERYLDEAEADIAKYDARQAKTGGIASERVP